MPSPFPGMDPYLEPYWHGVHTLLIGDIWRTISPALPPGLFAHVEERVRLEADPDAGPDRRIGPDVRVFEPGGVAVAVRRAAAVAAPLELVRADDDPVVQRYLRIVDGRNRLITVVELVSPSNKRGRGLTRFRRNRNDLLSAGVQFVEIDLTRAGRWRRLMRPYRVPRHAATAYRAVVHTTGSDDRRAFLYPMSIRDPLPPVAVPLRPGDDPVAVALQPLVDDIYRVGRYDRLIDYAEPPDPPLDPDDAAWASELLAARR